MEKRIVTATSSICVDYQDKGSSLGQSVPTAVNQDIAYVLQYGELNSVYKFYTVT